MIRAIFFLIRIKIKHLRIRAPTPEPCSEGLVLMKLMAPPQRPGFIPEPTLLDQCEQMVGSHLLAREAAARLPVGKPPEGLAGNLVK